MSIITHQTEKATHTTGATDEEDVRRLLVDDIDAGFIELVVRYQPGVHAGALRLTRHPHDAEEIAQETFLRAYRSLADFDRARILALQPKPWLWTIALNLCRNRATRTRPTEPLDVEQGAHLDTEPLDVEVWRRRLSALNETQRTAVVLRHVADLSVADIAQVVDRPEGTVKADISRGLARLRTTIDTEETP